MNRPFTLKYLSMLLGCTILLVGCAADSNEHTPLEKTNNAPIFLERQMMSDKETTVADLKALAEKFVTERDWRQFHGAKNLSMAIVAEAAELMELFMWARDAKHAANIVEEKQQAVTEELADIVWSVLMFCNEFNIDLSMAIQKKMIKNAAKYPIEKAKGVGKKYTEL